MKKNGFTLIELLISIGITAVSLLILLGISLEMAESRLHNKAIEAGMGEYVICDKSTGITEFKWKSNTNNILKPWLTSTITNDSEVYTINIYKQ